MVIVPAVAILVFLTELAWDSVPNKSHLYSTSVSFDASIMPLKLTVVPVPEVEPISMPIESPMIDEDALVSIPSGIEVSSMVAVNASIGEVVVIGSSVGIRVGTGVGMSVGISVEMSLNTQRRSWSR